MIDGKTTQYTYDKANQLVSSTCGEKTKYFAYDAAGRLVKEGTKSYNYSYMDKVRSVSENGAVTASFTYDVDGQIATAKTHATGKQESFLWDGLALIHRGGTSYINEPYVTGGNPILADNRILFNDMLGSTLGSHSDEGYTPVRMTAFGESDNADAFFTGKPLVGELGYTFLFRNYRPEQGKWQTTDPLGYPDGWNNFAYVNNSVTLAVDFAGGYEIEWEGTWTQSEKNRVIASFNNVASRISTICAQINSQIAHIESIKNNDNVCLEKANALISTISTLKNNLNVTLSNINSSTYNLEIYKKDFNGDPYASYWVSPVPWYDDELRLDFSWFSGSIDNKTIFHELMHTWTDDGESNDDFKNSHMLESLYNTDFSRWLVYKNEYDKIFE